MTKEEMWGEIQRKKELLDILKKQLCIDFTDDGEYESDIYYLSFKNEDNTLNNKNNPDDFHKVEEWLND